MTLNCRLIISPDSFLIHITTDGKRVQLLACVSFYIDFDYNICSQNASICIHETKKAMMWFYYQTHSRIHGECCLHRRQNRTTKKCKNTRRHKGKTWWILHLRPTLAGDCPIATCKTRTVHGRGPAGKRKGKERFYRQDMAHMTVSWSRTVSLMLPSLSVFLRVSNTPVRP